MNIQFPEKDKSILNKIGFNVTAFISCGSFGDVFNGVCNDKASKHYEMSENEAMNDQRDVQSNEGKFYRQIFKL